MPTVFIQFLKSLRNALLMEEEELFEVFVLAHFFECFEELAVGVDTFQSLVTAHLS